MYLLTIKVQPLLETHDLILNHEILKLLGPQPRELQLMGLNLKNFNF